MGCRLRFGLWGLGWAKARVKGKMKLIGSGFLRPKFGAAHIGKWFGNVVYCA
jgi:hypothetical protein